MFFLRFFLLSPDPLAKEPKKRKASPEPKKRKASPEPKKRRSRTPVKKTVTKRKEESSSYRSGSSDSRSRSRPPPKRKAPREASPKVKEKVRKDCLDWLGWTSWKSEILGLKFEVLEKHAKTCQNYAQSLVKVYGPAGTMPVASRVLGSIKFIPATALCCNPWT